MGVLFLVIPGLMIAGAIGAMVWAVLRMERLRAAWKSGITADGRCLSVYLTTTTTDYYNSGTGARTGGHSSTTWHHVYEFATPDGRVHRFKESGGRATVVRGDSIVIRYPAGRPDQATAIPPSEQAKQLLMTGCLLIFLTGFIAVAAVIATIGHDVGDKVGNSFRNQVTNSPTVPAGWPGNGSGG